MFPKIGVFPPNHPFVNRVFHYKPSILGVFPLFLETTLVDTTGFLASISSVSPRKNAVSCGDGPNHLAELRSLLLPFLDRTSAFITQRQLQHSL